MLFNCIIWDIVQDIRIVCLTIRIVCLTMRIVCLTIRIVCLTIRIVCLTGPPPPSMPPHVLHTLLWLASCHPYHHLCRVFVFVFVFVFIFLFNIFICICLCCGSSVAHPHHHICHPKFSSLYATDISVLSP